MDIKDSPLRIHLVLHSDNEGWIIEKIAIRLREQLSQLGVAVSLSREQRNDVDINHWMSYAFANVHHHTRATMQITHIDDPYKARLIKGELQQGVDMGICMSSDSVERLVHLGAPREKLCYVLPAHDGLVKSRRICIGITTNLYTDGRKRESFLLRLAKDINLDVFRFQIFGSGWDHIVSQLRSTGATVEFYPGSDDYQTDYACILSHIPEFDYYLYMGMDEGSLGTLDAIAAGIKTIVTRQGFHLDLGHGLTHLFETYDEMLEIIRSLADEQRRRLAVGNNLTWECYARRHLLIWNAILGGQERTIPELLYGNVSWEPNISKIQGGKEGISFWLRLLYPRRILSALSHWGPLKTLRPIFRRGRK